MSKEINALPCEDTFVSGAQVAAAFELLTGSLKIEGAESPIEALDIERIAGGHQILESDDGSWRVGLSVYVGPRNRLLRYGSTIYRRFQPFGSTPFEKKISFVVIGQPDDCVITSGEDTQPRKAHIYSILNGDYDNLYLEMMQARAFAEEGHRVNSDNPYGHRLSVHSYEALVSVLRTEIALQAG